MSFTTGRITSLLFDTVANIVGFRSLENVVSICASGCVAPVETAR